MKYVLSISYYYFLDKRKNLKFFIQLEKAEEARKIIYGSDENRFLPFHHHYALSSLARSNHVLCERVMNF